MQGNNISAKKLLYMIPWLLSGPLFYLLFRLSFLWPDFTENVYSRSIFRVLNQGISTVTGIFSFSLAEILLYSFILFVFIYIIIMIIRALMAKKAWWFELVKRILILLCVFSCVYALFIGLWGFNYARDTLGKTLGLNTSPATVNELYSTCEALTAKANALRVLVPENSHGVFSPDFTKQQMMQSATYYYNKAAQATGEDLLGGSYGNVKPVIYSTGLSYAFLTGVYFPFTGESNVNVDVPMLFFPSSCLHETAHQRGFAREDEANFLAYYVSSYSDNVSVEYSGTMLALTEAMNQLYDQDSDLYFQLRDTYPSGIDKDYKDNSEYWQKFESPVKETSKTVNNTFLQANMQQDGVKSYGRMVDLLIGLWRKGEL
jgi:hypothetical protein